jgi:hypothetical protein
MRRGSLITATLGGCALLVVILAGCTKGGGSIDLGQFEDNQVALDVEGMV